MAYKLPNGDKMNASAIKIKGNPHKARTAGEVVNPFDKQSQRKRQYNRKHRSSNKDFLSTTLPKMVAYVGGMGFAGHKLNKFLNQ